MKITEDGQVTIPEEIRKRCGLLPGSEVEFEVVGDAVQLKKKDGDNRLRGWAMVEYMRGKGTGSPGMTANDSLARARGED
jgi:AbrB family looped-hinge helix DNA binding protein